MKSLHRSVKRSRRNRTAAILVSAVGVIITAPTRVHAQDVSSAFWNGDAGDGKYENAGNWVDAGATQDMVPPADNATLGDRTGNANNENANITIDAATMAWYTANRGTPAAGPVNVGTFVLGEGGGSTQATTGNATLNFNAGTFNIGTLFIGGWMLNHDGYGTLIMNGGLITAGALSVGAQNDLTVQASHGTLIMAGTGSGGEIDYGSGSIFFGGRESTGYVSVSNGLLSGTGTIVIGGSTFGQTAGSKAPGVGSLNISGTGQVLAAGILLNTGSVQSSITGSLSDTIALSGGTLSAGVIKDGAGSVGMTTSVTFTGGALTVGTFRLTLDQQGGTLSPGTAGALNGGTGVGSVNLFEDSSASGKGAGHANYTLESNAHLLLDVGNGTNDVVHLENASAAGVSLTATLDSNSEIDIRAQTPAQLYNPSTSDGSFTVLTADHIVTKDSNNDNPAPLPSIKDVGDDSYFYSVSRNTNGQVTIPESLTGTPTGSGDALYISFAGHALPGDATKDKVVGTDDFDALAAHFGDTGGLAAGIGWAEGDFNGDGIVNALDFNALATDYGKTGTVENPTNGAIAEDASPSAIGSLVPEPVSGTILLGVAGLGLLGRKRRN